MVYGLAALINLILVVFIHLWVPNDPCIPNKGFKYSAIIGLPS